jgi:hypothetical protein
MKEASSDKNVFQIVGLKPYLCVVCQTMVSEEGGREREKDRDSEDYNKSILIFDRDQSLRYCCCCRPSPETLWLENNDCSSI